MPGIMRAAYIEATGPAESVTAGTLPTPASGPTDALVAVEAAAVNQVDTYVRSGRWPTSLPLPFVVGRDLVGTVVQGDAAGKFAPSDRVWCNSLGIDGRQGPTAEYAVVPVDRLYRLPVRCDPVDAVASLHPAATAFLGLHRRARLRAGDTVLVGGGAGSVGRCVIQLAAVAGARVIATSSADDLETCRQLGADVALDYHDPGLADNVMQAAPEGVDLYWDTSGHVALVSVATLVKPGGRILVTAGRDAQPPTPLWPLYTRDLSVVGFVISRATAGELADAADAINTHLADQDFGIAVADVVPLEQTAQAHKRVESGQRGRIVVRVADRT
jgi:NADPH:quinone reductase-like Zn-dependent oxidoreductase